MESLFETIATATKPKTKEEQYAEIKERYSLACKDWYYWPLSDDEGQAEAQKRLDAVGKELNEFKASMAGK